MTTQKVVLAKSDRERLIDLSTTLVGLAVLAYLLHPDPFDRAFEKVQAVCYSWAHRVSIWDALRAIRSLPETEDS